MTHCCFSELSSIDTAEDKSLGFMQSHCSHLKIWKQFLPSVQSACCSGIGSLGGHKKAKGA